MGGIRVGIIGDFDPAFAPHAATAAAIGHAADHLGWSVSTSWVATDELDRDPEPRLAEYDALWCAPGSPYRSMDGALAGIRVARESDRPFIGTCGGFQHVVIEYARHVLGYVDAEHAEYDPFASRLFITPLSCSLVGRTMTVRILPGSHAALAYGRTTAEERYYCNFGLNPAFQGLIHEGGLRVVGSDGDGEARIVELPEKQFFIATLYVPQLTSTPTVPHPLIVAYLAAARQLAEARAVAMA